MAKKAFDQIMAGLTDALAYAEGDSARGKAHAVEVPAVDVKAARKKLGLSQDRFSAAFGISPSTLRKWEQGVRQPEGPARVLLTVIDKEPEAVLRAVVASRSASSSSPRKRAAKARLSKEQPRKQLTTPSAARR